jgi:hypothetical protein
MRREMQDRAAAQPAGQYVTTLAAVAVTFGALLAFII